MQNTTRHELNYATGCLCTDAAERRRAGRGEHTYPTLIALLRAPTPNGEQKREVEKDKAPAPVDDLVSARGILLSVALGASMWGVIFTVVWLLTR
jgi:hypothetical protein